MPLCTPVHPHTQKLGNLRSGARPGFYFRGCFSGFFSSFWRQTLGMEIRGRKTSVGSEKKHMNYKISNQKSFCHFQVTNT